MSDLSIPQKDQMDEKGTPSGVMLTTMLLLIGGLLLTSTLMVNHALGSKNSTDENPFTFSIDSLIKKGSTYTDQITTSYKQAVAQIPDTEKKGTDMFSFVNGDKDRWPKLELTGFGRAANSKDNFAIINNQPVLLNQEIGKVTLVEIRARNVVVEYKGERKTLAIDTNN